ncbi:MAG: hypothetical protein ACJAWL_000928 [Motiliproteus sp.]|jgi:hypothetical protein
MSSSKKIYATLGLMGIAQPGIAGVVAGEGLGTVLPFNIGGVSLIATLCLIIGVQLIRHTQLTKRAQLVRRAQIRRKS